ncbi:MAG: glycosyltransferase family 4 protein [Candidatus Moranbacteria bacterium]|nr:glycosyltransferase family 4 protein [Candidatus Moranbacteria bacterium]
MRIGINASFLRKPGTGIGQVTWHFLESLGKLPEAKNHEFFLYTEEEVFSPKLGQNFTIKAVMPKWRRDDQIRKWLWEKQVLPREVVADTCDVFLSLYQSASIMPIPHVVLVHDLIPEVFQEYRRTFRQKFFWREVKQALRKARLYIAVSKYTKTDMEKLLHIEAQKIAVCHPSIDPLFQEEVSIAEKARVILKYNLPESFLYHGGGTEIRKNTEGVLRAYRELKKILAKNELPKLVISGYVHSAKNKLATPVEKLVAEYGLSEEVIVLGYVAQEDMAALYSLARLFIYPSRYEGFGLPVLEAMTVGVPVITSRVSSLPEVGGTAVLYTELDNPQALALLIKKTLGDESVLSKMSENGKLIAKHFTWKEFTEGVLRQTLHVCRQKK